MKNVLYFRMKHLQIDNYTHSHSPNINNQLLENSIKKTIAFYTHIGISCKRIHEHYKFTIMFEI